MLVPTTMLSDEKYNTTSRWVSGDIAYRRRDGILYQDYR